MTLAFFRRHRKWFMVLMFGALISMVFFGSWSYMGKLREWFGVGGPRQVVGTIDGEKVRESQRREFEYVLRLAGEASRAFAMVLEPAAKTPEARQQLYGYTVGMTAWPLLASTVKGERPDRLTVLTWMALYEEAQRYGFDASTIEVEGRLEGLAEMGLTPQILNRFLEGRKGVQRELLVEGMRKDMALRAYINWLSETLGAPVEAELRREFAQMDERIKVRLAVLKAEDALADVADVPDDVLQEQFGKYKRFLVGQSPEGYGYRIADKVAIEYLVADPAGFEAEAAPKVTDEAIRAYYDARKDPDFLVVEKTPEEPKAPAEEKKDVPAEGAKGEPGTEGAQPADAQEKAPEKVAEKPAEKTPEVKAPEKKFRPFEEVREEIRKTLLRREASVLARERLNADVAEIRPMKPAPKLGIWADGKQVRYVAVPGRHTAEGIAKLEAIGQATRGKESLADYALGVVGLMPAEKAKIGVMEISDVCLGPDGEAYAFRVTAIEPNHEPGDLKEVRDKVLADVRLAKAFGIVRDRGKELLESAAAKGLESAAKDAKIKTVESDFFPREIVLPYGSRWLSMPSSLPEIGTSRPVVSECFRMAAEGRQRALVTLAERRMVVVAELVDHKAPREAGYQRMRPLLVQKVAQQLGDGALRQALDMGAIQRRMIVLAEAEVEGASAQRQGEEPAESEEW
ncbi:MAG: hypothetical protein IMZ66_10940 [Planctomycetes bacterium]|nr:hypothetical protein [Planctomycetota bacterium]